MIFFSLQLDDWIFVNISRKFDLDFGKGNAIILFAVTAWLLWKHRNQVIFQQSVGTLKELLCSATYFAGHIAQVIAISSKLQRVEGYQTRWCPPEANWVKINTDGASSRGDNVATVGGLARDQHGAWLSGFQRSVGYCSALDAKL